MKISLALAVVAASLTLPAAPAQADLVASAQADLVAPAQADLVAPDRFMGESPFDTVDYKPAVARCDVGQVVFGMGGRINNGGGRVALTAVMPDPTGQSVVVWGRALPGNTTPWSVTAVAICHTPGLVVPEHVTSEVRGQYLATAACTDGKVLYSQGFQILNADGGEFLRALVPTADLSHVVARVGGPGVDPANLVAHGICAYPRPVYARVQTPPTAFDPTSPKDATAGLPPTAGPPSWMFGAGAEVEGAPNVLIDAIFPTPDKKGAYGRAQRATGTANSARATAEGDDDWQLTVYGDYLGECC